MTVTHTMIVMLLPVSELRIPDPVWQNPTVEKCPSCVIDCWMTDRKRILRETGHECLCGFCAIKKYGAMDVIDITKPN